MKHGYEHKRRDIMRSSRLSFATSALVCAVATTAFAQDATRTDVAVAFASAPAPVTTGATATVAANTDASGGKFIIAARLGYEIGMGSVESGERMSNSFSGQVPIGIEVGYMVSPSVVIGLYGQYGFGILGSQFSDACSAANLSCSAHAVRFGVQGQYHLSPAEKLDPWFGVGLGYEMATMSISGNYAGTIINGSGTYKGFEFLDLQGGTDFKLSSVLGIGPFLNFSIGEYGSVSASGALPGGPVGSGSIGSKTVHEWLTFGVRGAFTL
jgi:outer membrane protein W